MIFRGDSASSDWTFGRGKQCYLSGNAAIMRNIETRLKTFYSECFFARTEGVPWFDVLGRKDKDALLLALRQAILDSYGVIRVVDVQYSVDSDRTITVNYWVDTLYSASSQGSITL